MTKQIIILAIVAVALTGCTHQAQKNQEQQDVPTTPINEQVTSKTSIRLTSPQAGQVLKSPFLVGGEAIVPNNTVYIRVKNPSGDIVISEQSRVKTESGEAGPFGVLLSFVFQATDSGIVEVYGIDPDSGEEVSLQSVSVNFDTSGNGSTQTPN